MGFLFIVFLSLITRFGITKLIENADLLSTYSPEDVLDIFGTMKIIESRTEIRQAVPKEGAGSRRLHPLLNFLYPTLQS